MMWRICETCAHSAWRDGKTAVTEVCLICTFGKDGQPTNWKEKSMTNGDRVRSMSDEELADWLTYFDRCEHCAYEGHCTSKCIGGIKQWLKQPAEEESG